MAQRSLATALLCALALGFGLPAGSQPALRTITLGVTSRTANDWTTFIADKYGFFAANGLKPDVVVVGVNSGVAQQLTGGAFDLGEVTTTQMVLAVQGGAPLVSVENSGSGVPYSLIAKKGLTSTAQLKGKLISIGGPSDITRPFMDTIMERSGFKPDDWTYTFAGSSADRYAALVAGAIDATLLAPPMSFKAIAQGFPVLDEVPKYFPNFPYVTWAVRPAWAKDHAEVVVSFIKAELQAARWLNDPANRQKAIALLMDQTNSSVDDATKSYGVFVTEEHYFSTTGTFTPDSFSRVLQTMIKAGMLQPPAPAATKFYDNGYAERANVQLRGK
jgi:ABC-type nitrate/sulfonate/bicarbonate transport system substrate-binding protein